MASKRYILDAKASQFTVQAFAEGLAGIADHRPRFAVRAFSGEVTFDKDKRDIASLHLTARAGSLEIMDDVTENDRKSIERVMFGEVLHPLLYPEVVFRSSQVACSLVSENRYSVEMAGTLSLHGVENKQAMQLQVILSSGSLRAYGEFRLKQSDYGLTIASVAGGMLQIKDEIKFVFFMVAREHHGD